MKQPHEMTDTELNRAMFWLYIENLPSYVKDALIEDNGGVLQIDLVECMWDIDFLEDWNLTMPLAHENGLSIDMSRIITYASSEGYRIYCMGHKNPLRAICEVLVAIAMEQIK